MIALADFRHLCCAVCTPHVPGLRFPKKLRGFLIRFVVNTCHVSRGLGIPRLPLDYP